METVIVTTLVIGGIGLFIGLFLEMAAIRFKVEIDSKEEKILNALPHINCGGCGYSLCSGLAAAIVKGSAPVNSCPVGGEITSRKIAFIMETKVTDQRKMAAYVHCQGNSDVVKEEYEYTGVENCLMMAYVPNQGPKACNYGCLGFGSCVKVCPFDAIHIVKRIAVVDKKKCRACKKCIAVCPKKLISLEPVDVIYDKKHHDIQGAGAIVTCNSIDQSSETTNVCEVGCTSCGICKKVCPSNAIIIQNNLASINQDKCTKCGLCKEKCPKKTIC